VDKLTFGQGLTILRASYPGSRIEFDDRLRDVWFSLLRDLDNQIFDLAIKALLRDKKFFPTVAEIREYAGRYHASTRNRTEDATSVVRITAEQQQRNQQRIKALLATLV